MAQPDERRMAVGEKMKKFRADNGITLKQASNATYATPFLLSQLEERDWITHPHIAARVADFYRLDVDDYNCLVADIHHTDALPFPEPPPLAPVIEYGYGDEYDDELYEEDDDPWTR